MCAWEADYLDQAVPGQSLAQPAASTCGCLDGFSAWRGLFYVGSKGEQSPRGEGGRKSTSCLPTATKETASAPFSLLLEAWG